MAMRQYSVISIMGLLLLGGLSDSCKKDEATGPTSTGPSLTVGQASFTLHAGDSSSTTISGGTPPYLFFSKGDTSKVAPLLSDSLLIVRAVAVGSSTIVIGDNSSPSLRARIDVTISVAPLTAHPTGVTLVGSTPRSVTILTGIHPYTIAQHPNPGLATALFVDPNLDSAVLVITGVSTATGSTSVIVRDASSPKRSVVVGISKVQ